jgi:hypothetical protein
MSTVLWANVLVQGKVHSDQADLPALYKHAEKLDAIAKSLGGPSFLGICDTSDQRFNLDVLELPAGMSDTNQYMAAHGSWMPAREASEYLQRLRDHVVEKRVRFGLLANQHAQVVAELDEVLAFVKTQVARAEKFNFSIVM